MKMTKKKHPLYTTWNGMMYRCYKPYHSHFKYYGGIGVRVDERWHDFWNFVEDVNNNLLNGHLLYYKGWVLDKDERKSKLYSLSTCVVLSDEENSNRAREKQMRRVLATNKIEKVEYVSLAEASTLLGIKRSSIISCINRGNRHKSSGYSFSYIT